MELFVFQVVEDYTFAEALENLAAQDLSLKYVFGTSLFLGWAALAVGTLGGAVMLCGSCYVESEEEEYWNRGKVGRGLQRVRHSFRESYRLARPKKSGPPMDYV